MKSLNERKKQREYFAKVNSGEVKDTKVTLGQSADGTPLGEGGEAAEKDDSADDANAPFDYTKLRSHDDLNGEKGLNGRDTPEGWDGMNVKAKQEWLSANRAEGGEGTAQTNANAGENGGNGSGAGAPGWGSPGQTGS